MELPSSKERSTHNEDVFSNTISQIQDSYGQEVLPKFKLHDWLQKSLSQKPSSHMGTFDYLNEGNTILFDDTPYRVMWNMQGTYIIFPKFINQSSHLLGSFLKDVIIPWLCGWLFVRDKREYTIKKFVKFHSDPETDYILQCYMSQRTENLKKDPT